MARIHGQFSDVYVGIGSSSSAASPVAFASKWSADFKTDKKDATAFSDNNKVYVAGLPDSSGSYEGFFDTATAQLYTAANDGQPRYTYFYPTTPSTAGPYWYGTAYWDFSVEASVDDVVKVKGTWNAATNFTKIG